MKNIISIFGTLIFLLTFGLPPFVQATSPLKVSDCKNRTTCLIRKAATCQAVSAAIRVSRRKEPFGLVFESKTAHYQIAKTSSGSCTLKLAYTNTKLEYTPQSILAMRKRGMSNIQIKTQEQDMAKTLKNAAQECSGSPTAIAAFLKDSLKGNASEKCHVDSGGKSQCIYKSGVTCTTLAPQIRPPHVVNMTPPTIIPPKVAPTSPNDQLPAPDTSHAQTPISGMLVWSAPVNVGTSSVIHGIFCLSDSFCIGVDHAGNVVTSTNPAGGKGAWTVTQVDAGRQLDAISCPSSTLCVATAVNMSDFSGDILTSTNPTGGASAWTVAHIPQTGGIGGLWCPSPTLCVAADHNGDILTSTNPTGGASAWTVTHLDQNTIHGVYCPSNAFCIAGDEAGNILTSTNPTGGASAWTITPLNLPSPVPILGVSCSSPSFCAVVDGPGGDVLISTNPTGGSGAWTLTHIGNTGFGGISCPSSTLCVAASGGGTIAILSNLAGAMGTWNIINVDPSPLWDVFCPSNSFCAASDSSGNVVIGKIPKTSNG